MKTLSKALIALMLIVSATFATVQTAQAHVRFDFGIGIGAPLVYPYAYDPYYSYPNYPYYGYPYYGYPYYQSYYPRPYYGGYYLNRHRVFRGRHFDRAWRRW